MRLSKIWPPFAPLFLSLSLSFFVLMLLINVRSPNFSNIHCLKDHKFQYNVSTTKYPIYKNIRVDALDVWGLVKNFAAAFFWPKHTKIHTKNISWNSEGEHKLLVNMPQNKVWCLDGPTHSRLHTSYFSPVCIALCSSGKFNPKRQAQQFLFF